MNLVDLRRVLFHLCTPALTISFLMSPCLAADSLQVRWVHGSFVNLRAEAGSKAQVIGKLTANTPVTLLSQGSDWCEVEAKQLPARGYMACSLLGPAPLSLAEVGLVPQPGEPANPRYSATRAFWVSPSVGRLLAAGNFFWETMLNATQQKKERPFDSGEARELQEVFNWDTKVKPLRFSIPEFDAMKDLMKGGVIAPQDQQPTMVKATVLEGNRTSLNNGYVTNVGLEGADTLIQQGRLPQVQASLFKRVEDLAPRSVSVEQVSAQFGLKVRLRVIDGPGWVHHRHDEPRVAGSWDIGSYELSLEKPVVEHVIGRTGLIAAKYWTGTERQSIDAEGGCSEGLDFARRGNTPITNYPTVKDPLVLFYTAVPLPYKKAKIKTYAKRPMTPKDGAKPRADTGFSLMVMHEIDLNNDGIADLSVWEAMQPVQGAGDRVGWRYVFVNIAGEWYLMEQEQFGECS